MPEIRFDLQFKDKVRQKARLKKLEGRAAEKKKSEAPIQKQKKSKESKIADQPEKRVPAAKRRMLEDRQDVSEFADEYTLLKRLKKGKMTEVHRNSITCLLALVYALLNT